ncbi:class I SAM-dependent DNA methyltransferase [Ammoniphilus oxalaticus]|uniref:class I SAM-dependent DNA methyltransferase n=1 Tax=Ammoniphilus oxalaticus TaxID=66863 RepID=UPI001FE7330E|nr:class I SAM-dependent methyltransferase [Ammoniphilus oxalaticus]
MSVSYTRLAQVYDRFMADAPYEEWVRFAESEWMQFQLTPKKVMDLACGTGSISVLLAKRGYQVTGIDLSEEMLTIAEEKGRGEGVRLQLYQQDMVELRSPEPMDSIICFCDSLNYITDPQAVFQTFEGVYRSLKPGGVFLFDVHSLYKIKDLFADQSFHWIEDDLVYVWDCQAEEENLVTHFLTFFAREGELYRRFEETHLQRGYSEQQLRTWLEEVGFANIHCHADLTNMPPVPTSERLFFSCQRPM